jgi:hypothetical protein
MIDAVEKRRLEAIRALLTDEERAAILELCSMGGCFIGDRCVYENEMGASQKAIDAVYRLVEDEQPVESTTEAKPADLVEDDEPRDDETSIVIPIDEDFTSDDRHVRGDTACGVGRCGAAKHAYPRWCSCGGLIHAAFGDENKAGDVWLATKCDRCGTTRRG